MLCSHSLLVTLTHDVVAMAYALKEIIWSKKLTYVGKSSCPQTTQPTLVILTNLFLSV